MAPLQSADEEWLRQVASGTWAFFEQFVNPDGNWLPPDNVQAYPREKVAWRISPTNEGLFLISGLVARRLGFIGAESLVELWEKNLASWNSLQKLHGHHFNWYATNELKALHPYYVSTVDSGNLMACYFTLCAGISDLGEQPLISMRHRNGVLASFNWLKQRTETEIALTDQDSDNALPQRSRLAALLLQIEELQRLTSFDGSTFTGIATFVQSLGYSAVKLNEWASASDSKTGLKSVPGIEISVLALQVRIVAERLYGIGRDVQQFMPWMQAVAAMEVGTESDKACLKLLANIVVPGLGLHELAQLPTMLAKPPHSVDLSCEDSNAGDSLIAVLAGIRAGARAASALLQRLKLIREQCESAAQKMDFRFLYNARRKLFSIGYNVAIGKLDRTHYDLLCSECRIASFLAIAKADIETDHWFHLGRQATSIDGNYSLLSWGGTMFEFLMPQLFQRSYDGSLIDTSCRTAIDRQIDYGRQMHVPWGISESAYSAMASNSDYRYKSFGVPGLGLKRGLSKDIVVSPYSAAMALPFAPKSATSNLKTLAVIAMGHWGFFDAVDYTPKRQRRNQKAHVVRNYMAHHQGICLLGIANTIDDHIITRWFHAHPLVRANELLLQERVPELVDSDLPNPDEVEH